MDEREQLRAARFGFRDEFVFGTDRVERQVEGFVVGADAVEVLQTHHERNVRRETRLPTRPRARFTTGRGTPLGVPAPTLKIASNSPLAQRKTGWIDFDAGRVLEAGFDDSAEALLDLIAATASGALTKAELNEERDIAIWKSGVTL